MTTFKISKNFTNGVVFPCIQSDSKTPSPETNNPNMLLVTASCSLKHFVIFCCLICSRKRLLHRLLPPPPPVAITTTYFTTSVSGKRELSNTPGRLDLKFSELVMVSKVIFASVARKPTSFGFDGKKFK